MSKTCILVDHSDFLNMVGADEDASSNEPHHSEFITLDEASSHLDHASSHQQQSQEHQSVELLSREHGDAVAASFYQHFNINPSMDRRNNIICDEDTNADESVIAENNNQEVINVEEINNNDDEEEEKREEYVNDEYYENEECNPDNNPTNSRPSSIPSSPAKQTQPNARRSSSTLVLSTFPALTPPQSAVPKLANDEQVFESLCKKIAKYCQLLSKLTSCEVFYKAELTLSSQSGVNQSVADNSDELAAVSAAATLGSSSRTRPKRYQPKKARNPNVRSLYWGTDRLVRDFTHDRGIRFERLNGDSLISIEPALAISVENIESIIDEIVNGPALMPKKKYRQAPPPEIVREKQVPSPPPTISSLPSEITPSQSSSSLNPIVLKDSYVLLDRLDERVVDEHLNKLEQSNFVINFERSLNNTDTNDKINEYDNQEFNDTEENIYSDSDEHNLMNGKSQTLLNETEVYTCEICPHHSYRHLTQLKLHQLRMHHENNDEYIEYSDERRQLLEDGAAPYRCAKCGQEFGDQRLEYRKHMITCVEPDAYACKTCDRVHSSYDHYRMHVTYVHPPLVYMCTVCGRKYRRMCDLVEHDRFGCSPPPQSHSHANILDSEHPRSSAADSEVASHHSCEFCHAVFVSRQQLFQHYLSNHLRRSGTKKISSNENDLDDQEEEKEENSNEESHQIETINSRRSNLKEPQPMTHDPSPSTPITQKITLESSTNNSVVVLNRSSDELLHHADDETDDDVNMNSSTAAATATTTTPPAVDKKTLIRGLIDRKYQCRWCELKFYQKKHLQHHEQSHHKNRMLTCPVCDKTFERKDRLNGHMKCHMEPSLECKICGKKFKRPCNLYNHELVHGLTEHAFMLCQFCNRGFRSRRDYQNHVLANHRDVILNQNGGSQQQKDDNNNNEEEFSNQLLDSSQTPPPSTSKSSSSKSSRRAAQKHSSTDHLSSSSGSNQSIKIVSHEVANTSKKLVVKIVDNSATTQMTSNSTINGVKRKRTETEASETYITRTETIDLSDEHLAHLLGVANETTDFG